MDQMKIASTCGRRSTHARRRQRGGTHADVDAAPAPEHSDSPRERKTTKHPSTDIAWAQWSCNHVRCALHRVSSPPSLPPRELDSPRWHAELCAAWLAMVRCIRPRLSGDCCAYAHATAGQSASTNFCVGRKRTLRCRWRGGRDGQRTRRRVRLRARRTHPLKPSPAQIPRELRLRARRLSSYVLIHAMFRT